MSDNSNNAGGGAGFASLLLIAFIVLKLCNVINWSWWWVLSPFWIPLCLVILGFGIYFLYLTIRDRKPKAKIQDRRSKWEIRMEEMQARQKETLKN